MTDQHATAVLPPSNTPNPSFRIRVPVRGAWAPPPPPPPPRKRARSGAPRAPSKKRARLAPSPPLHLAEGGELSSSDDDVVPPTARSAASSADEAARSADEAARSADEAARSADEAARDTACTRGEAPPVAARARTPLNDPTVFVPLAINLRTGTMQPLTMCYIFIPTTPLGCELADALRGYDGPQHGRFYASLRSTVETAVDERLDRTEELLKMLLRVDGDDPRTGGRRNGNPRVFGHALTRPFSACHIVMTKAAAVGNIDGLTGTLADSLGRLPCTRYFLPSNGARLGNAFAERVRAHYHYQTVRGAAAAAAAAAS